MSNVIVTGDRSTISKNAQIALQLTEFSRDLVEEAAALTGQSIDDFILAAIIRESQTVLERHRQIVLSNRDRDLFLSMLDSDEAPNEALQKAAERYKQLVGD